jgi:AcrR family transcriptional regulator
MRQAVKTRTYRSAVRARRAEATRRRILQSARRLFRQRGYAGTTVEAIAERADVAPATVYLALGSKRAIVLSLVANVGTEPEMARLNAEIVHEPNPQRRLELAARITRVITAGAWDLMEVVRAGAVTDADLAEAWRRGEEDRLRAVAQAIRPIGKDGLRRGLSVEAAVDLVWALTGPELYGLLVAERGWSAARYERSLAALLAAALLSPPLPAAGSRKSAARSASSR